MSLPRFIALGVDDGVGQKQIIVAGVTVVVGQRTGADGIVVLKSVQAHVEASHGGSHMIWRTAQKTVVKLIPRHHRLAPDDELFVRAGTEPSTVHAVTGIRRLEGHALEVFREALKIVERSVGRNTVPKLRMSGDVVDFLAEVAHIASIVRNAFQVCVTVSWHNQFLLISADLNLEPGIRRRKSLSPSLLNHTLVHSGLVSIYEPTLLLCNMTKRYR